VCIQLHIFLLVQHFHQVASSAIKTYIRPVWGLHVDTTAHFSSHYYNSFVVLLIKFYCYVTCSVVRVSVLAEQMSCAKMAEPVKMLFWGLTDVGPRSHVLDGGLNPAMEKGHVPTTVKYKDYAVCRSCVAVMWPFAKLPWTLI